MKEDDTRATQGDMATWPIGAKWNFTPRFISQTVPTSSSTRNMLHAHKGCAFRVSMCALVIVFMSTSVLENSWRRFPYVKWHQYLRLATILTWGKSDSSCSIWWHRGQITRPLSIAGPDVTWTARLSRDPVRSGGRGPGGMPFGLVFGLRGQVARLVLQGKKTGPW